MRNGKISIVKMSSTPGMEGGSEVAPDGGQSVHAMLIWKGDVSPWIALASAEVEGDGDFGVLGPACVGRLSRALVFPRRLFDAGVGLEAEA